ncbi:MAG: serine/threonine-protein kinase [Planctomycetaceae bacterium]
MTDKPAHPCDTDLAAYGLGQLAPEAAAAVEEHIHRCEPCCETIAGLSDEDTFVGLLQDARRTPTEDTEIDGAIDFGTPEVPATLVDHPRYEVFGLIGKGGMGDVYEARHRMMNRTVALKVIKQEFVRRPEAVDRFQREVTAAAQLSHPNIVTAFDAEQAGHVHFLVMEHVDGTNLSQAVNDRGSLSVAEACDYVRQVAVGLQHAHEQGMVHRDIKPHNLMVTGDRTVKILDFGLASLAPQPTAEGPLHEDADGNLTIAGSIMGTPDFISPEQAQDAHNVDGRSDIYSLGMTLYFLLSGKAPFSEGSATDKLKLHAESHPVRLSEIRADVPDGVQKIFDRMTAKDPSERFQSPQDVADALEEYFGAPPASKARKRIGDGGRSRWWLIAVVLLLGAFWTFMYMNPRMFSWRVAKKSDVQAPISELESYVTSMAASPHNLVFMNVGDLGSDRVALEFTKAEDGFLVRINVPSSGHGQSRGKYISRMKEIAAGLSASVTEEAWIAEDGAVSGASFVFRLTGQPSAIAKNVQQIVTRGLALNGDAKCYFQCRNFPSQLTRSDDFSARSISGPEFVAEHERGERVFLGENEQHVFLIPEARRYESPVTMNDEIWYADVRDLPPGFAAQLRLQAAGEWTSRQPSK